MRYLCWVALGLCALSGACIDPKKEYDDFNHRLADKKARDEDAAMHMHMMDMDASGCMSVTPEQLEGKYLFALRLMGYEDKPILNELTLQKAVASGDDFELPFLLQPLTVATHKPSGSPAMGKAVLKGGSMYIVDKFTVMTPGDSDPVVAGQDVTAVINVQAMLCGDGQPVQQFCGASDGDITYPTMITINDSTFTAQRITGAALPTLITSCDDMKAKP